MTPLRPKSLLLRTCRNSLPPFLPSYLHTFLSSSRLPFAKTYISSRSLDKSLNPSPRVCRVVLLLYSSCRSTLDPSVVAAAMGVEQTKKQEDHRDPYMWIKSFTANGAVIDALTLNRGSEMMYVHSKTNEILVRGWPETFTVDGTIGWFGRLVR